MTTDNGKWSETAGAAPTVQYSDGYEFWRDVLTRHGKDEGFVIGGDYLTAQLKTSDPSELRFRRELFEAMQETRGFVPNRAPYPYSLSEARERGELEMFNRSRELDSECADAVCVAINSCRYERSRYNLDGAMYKVLNDYGFERVNRIMAAYIQAHDRDGRFSSANREWARTFPEVPENHGVLWALGQSHSVLLDAFAAKTREVYTELDGQRFSVPEDCGADVHKDYDLYRSAVFENGHGFALGCSGNDSERCVVWEFDERDGVREYGDCRAFYGEQTALDEFNTLTAKYMAETNAQIRRPERTEPGMTMTRGGL